MSRVADNPGLAATRIRDALAGKYRVEALLGSGGMGTVVRAHHILLGRPVAIKVMHSDLLLVDDAARRFALEARATAALKSPHAVRIVDIDHLPTGVPFIVMELLDGKDLASIVAERGPLSVEQACRYVLQATHAVAEAHGMGIVHRDLKPENMILTRDGIVKVVDFGLAKAFRTPGQVESSDGPDSAQTAAHALVGSPSYMSPEQLRSSRDVDYRTDIWALGVTLYHLLTGDLPFHAPNLPMLTNVVLTAPAPRVGDVRRVPPATDAVIARCLAKDPARRYPSITALQTALVHALADRQHIALAETRVSPGNEPQSSPDRTLVLGATRTADRGPDSEPPTMMDPTELGEAGDAVDAADATAMMAAAVPAWASHAADDELPTAIHPAPTHEDVPVEYDDDYEDSTDVDVFGGTSPRTPRKLRED